MNQQPDPPWAVRLDEQNQPLPGTCTEEANGCRIWLGARDQNGSPIVCVRGKRNERVRRLMLHAPRSAKTTTTCGTPGCVALEHIRLVGKPKTEAAVNARRQKMRDALTAPPRERRATTWSRGDMRELIAEMGTERGGIPPKSWWTVVNYSQGWTQDELADVLEISQEAVRTRIVRADRRLRMARAQRQRQQRTRTAIMRPADADWSSGRSEPGGVGDENV